MIDLIHPSIEELRAKWMPIVEKTKRIYTWTTDDELCWIAEYATRCTHYLEIGSYVGRSAKVAMIANPQLHLTSLDTWDDDETLDEYFFNLRDQIKDGRVLSHQGESQRAFNWLVGQVFDGCWIDGAHLAHLVEADIRNVIPLMAGGSLMAGHDYLYDNDVAHGVHAVIGRPHNPVGSIWCYQL